MIIDVGKELPLSDSYAKWWNLSSFKRYMDITKAKLLGKPEIEKYEKEINVFEWWYTYTSLCCLGACINAIFNPLF